MARNEVLIFTLFIDQQMKLMREQESMAIMDISQLLFQIIQIIMAQYLWEYH
mgnify:FL=1